MYSRIILLVQPPVKELPTFPFLGFYSHNVTARHGIKKEAPSCAWRKNTSLGIWDLVFVHLFDPRFIFGSVPSRSRAQPVLCSFFLLFHARARKGCTAKRRSRRRRERERLAPHFGIACLLLGANLFLFSSSPAALVSFSSSSFSCRARDFLELEDEVEVNLSIDLAS